MKHPLVFNPFVNTSAVLDCFVGEPTVVAHLFGTFDNALLAPPTAGRTKCFTTATGAHARGRSC